MNHIPPHLYFQKGVQLGHSRDLLHQVEKHRSKLLSNGVTPVMSLRHLSYLTGVSYLYLRKVVQRQIDPYRDIVREKRTGGNREISSPHPLLRTVQRWILDNILCSIDRNYSSFAYAKGVSIVDCAGQHVGAKWLVKLDLHNFFGTIYEKNIYQIFRGLGFRKLISFELARLCTRMEENSTPVNFDRYTVIRSYNSGRQGILPQGAPTSGALANAVASNLDNRLQDIALSRGLVYTRYSDDLVFSAGPTFNRQKASDLIKNVSRDIQQCGFQVHRKKTRVVPPGARAVVLGLLVDESRVRLLPEYKRRIDLHVRGVSKFGLARHVKCRKFRSIFSFINHVDGLLAFAKSVEPKFYEDKSLLWSEALAKNGFYLPGEEG